VRLHFHNSMFWITYALSVYLSSVVPLLIHIYFLHSWLWAPYTKNMKYLTAIFRNNCFVLYPVPPFCFISLTSWHNSCGVMTGLQTRRSRNRESISAKGKRFFLPQTDHTGPLVHPICCEMNTRGSYPGSIAALSCTPVSTYLYDWLN
jgi:hypothetical protein